MTEVMEIIVTNLPMIGKTIAGIIGFGLVTFAIIYILYKNRHKIKANVCADLYLINIDGNLISKERIWGYEDPENMVKEVYFKKLEETLSLENAVPILEKAVGKIRKVYQVFRYPDGKTIISNPKIVPFCAKVKKGKEYFEEDYLFQCDNQLLDYKRWYSSEIIRAVEQRYREQMKDGQKKMMFMMVASFIACVVIVGIGVYFSTKIGILSLEMSFSGLTQQTNLLVTALQQNVSVIN